MAQCYICGTVIHRKVNREKDHVPPDCIFPDGDKPQNLITIYCCRDCHDEYDVLDERMRNYVALIAGESSSKAGEKAKRAVLRSPILRSDFISHMKDHPFLVDDGGNPRKLFYFDDDELERWLIRIVKGLFFHKYRRRMSDFCTYEIKKLPELIPKSSMTYRMEEGLELRPYFTYGVLLNIEKPNTDFWVIIFYDHLVFTVDVEIPNRIRH